MKTKIPSPSSPSASIRMKAVRRSGTLAELKIRKELDKLGIPYEVQERPISTLNRKADILFRESRIAVFIDGCFWHGCPIHGTKAKSNEIFWSTKIQTNIQRDEDTNRLLQEQGWLVVRIWEHENPEEAVHHIATLLKSRLF